MSAETPVTRGSAPTPNGHAPLRPPSFLQRFWLPTALVVATIVVVTVTGYEVVTLLELLMDPQQHGDQALMGATMH